MKNKKQLLSMLLLATCNVWAGPKASASPKSDYDIAHAQFVKPLQGDVQQALAKGKSVLTRKTNVGQSVDKKHSAAIDERIKGIENLPNLTQTEKQRLVGELATTKAKLNEKAVKTKDRNVVKKEKADAAAEKKRLANEEKITKATEKKDAADKKKADALAKKEADAKQKQEEKKAREARTLGASSVKLPFTNKTLRLPGTKIENANINSEVYTVENIKAKQMSQDNKTLESSFNNIQKVRSQSDIVKLDKYLADVKQKYDGLIGDTASGARPVNETTLLGRSNKLEDVIKQKQTQLEEFDVNSSQAKALNKELDTLKIDKTSIDRKLAQARYVRKTAIEKQDAIKAYKITQDYIGLQSKGKGATSTQPIAIPKKSAESKSKETTFQEDDIAEFGQQEPQVTPPVSASSAASGTNLYSQIGREEQQAAVVQPPVVDRTNKPVDNIPTQAVAAQQLPVSKFNRPAPVPSSLPASRAVSIQQEQVLQRSQSVVIPTNSGPVPTPRRNSVVGTSTPPDSVPPTTPPGQSTTSLQQALARKIQNLKSTTVNDRSAPDVKNLKQNDAPEA
jgi:hypothetical protein